MMTFLYRMLGLCPHTLSFPMMRKVNGKRIGEYRICTTCAKEFKYNFNQLGRIA